MEFAICDVNFSVSLYFLIKKIVRTIFKKHIFKNPKLSLV